MALSQGLKMRGRKVSVEGEREEKKACETKRRGFWLQLGCNPKARQMMTKIVNRKRREKKGKKDKTGIGQVMVGYNNYYIKSVMYYFQ